MSRNWLLAIVCLLILGLSAQAVWAVNKDDDEGFPVREGDEKKLKSGDRDPALLNRINAAILKGCNYLKSMQRPDGSWQGAWFRYAPPHKYEWGETALCLLALLKSGELRHSEVIEKGFKFLRMQPLKKTYEVSTLILALEARWAKQDVKKRIEKTAAVAKVRMKPRDLEWMGECVRFLLDNREMSWRIFGMDAATARQTPDSWHYPGPAGTPTDHSNTQFALLALKAARRCGIPIPSDVWTKVVMHFVDVQERSGPPVQRVRVIEDKKHGYVSYKPMTSVPDHARGWCYDATRNAKTKSSDKMIAATGSMTTVGISSLAIAVSELRGRDLNAGMRKKAETAMKDGLAWLDKNWSVKCNPLHPAKLWHYYYLYGVERAAVLTNRRAIGKHDWYREGAEFLLTAQKGDGQWDDNLCSGPLNNTSFALLFLTKATVPVGTVITGRH